MQIVIPSKGRPDTIRSHKLFPSAKIVVVDAEYDAYARRVGEDRLVVLPSHLSGLIDTRNFILDNWADERFVFMVDDDARGIGRNHVVGRFYEDDKPYKTCTITDPEYCEEMIYRLGELAESGGAWIFGFNFTKDKHFHSFEPFRVSGFIAAGMGFVKG